jgi:hypothetical protein
MSDVDRRVLEARQESSAIKKRVLALCRDYPSVKGDYRLLWYRYIQRFHGARLSFKERSFFDELRRMPSPETIGRRYRELCEEGVEGVLPSEATQRKRRKRERVMRSAYSRSNLWDFEVV